MSYYRIEMLYKIFQAHYALTKHTLGIPRGRKNNIYIRLLLIILTLLYVAVFLISLIVFAIFYVFLKAYIKFKKGDHFAGMMTGQDSLWQNIHIHSFLSVKSVETYEETVRRIKCSTKMLCESCNKLNYSIKSCWGYSYYVKNNLKLDDLFTEIDCEDVEYWTDDTLSNYLQEVFLKPGFLENKTWRLSYFKQPLCRSDGVRRYCFVFTINHCVCDGIALISLLKNKVCNKFEFIDLKSGVTTKVSKPTRLDDAYVFPTSALLKPQMSGDFKQLMTFFVESEPKYLPLVKQIKKKLDVGFGDILIAGFSVAFMEYVTKRKHRYQSLRVNYTVQPMDENVGNMIKGDYDYNNIVNNMILTAMNLEGDTCKDMLKTVLKMKRISKEYMGSVNVLLTKLFTSVIYMLPPLFKKLFIEATFQRPNILFTNISGIKSAESMGLLWENALFFVSPIVIANLSLFVTSDGDRFRMVILSRNDVIDNEDDLKEVTRRAFEYVELLNNELNEAAIFENEQY